MLDDNAALTHNFNSKSVTLNSYKPIKKYLLNKLNTFLKTVGKQSSSFCLNNCFSKHELSYQLPGSFGENSFAGMIEASNI